MSFFHWSLIGINIFLNESLCKSDIQIWILTWEESELKVALPDEVFDMKCFIFMHRAKFQCHASSQLSSTSSFSSYSLFSVISPLVPATPVTLTPPRWQWIPAAASSPWSITTTVCTSGTSRTSAKWASHDPSSSTAAVYGTWRYVSINSLAPGKFE